jgi:hypothetical protein
MVIIIAYSLVLVFKLHAALSAPAVFAVSAISLAFVHIKI